MGWCQWEIRICRQILRNQVLILIFIFLKFSSQISAFLILCLKFWLGFRFQRSESQCLFLFRILLYFIKIEIIELYRLLWLLLHFLMFDFDFDTNFRIFLFFLICIHIFKIGLKFRINVKLAVLSKLVQHLVTVIFVFWYFILGFGRLRLLIFLLQNRQAILNFFLNLLQVVMEGLILYAFVLFGYLDLRHSCCRRHRRFWLRLLQKVSYLGLLQWFRSFQDPLGFERWPPLRVQNVWFCG